MAASAPAAATTIWTTRDAGIAAQSAAAAYQAALASYSAGDQPSADSAARRAIQLAELAIKAATSGSQDIVETVSTGEVAAAAPAPLTPLPPVIVTAAVTTPATTSPSYADLRRLPFGAVPAEPVARIQPDSLPFGAIRVARRPALIAP